MGISKPIGNVVVEIILVLLIATVTGLIGYGLGKDSRETPGTVQQLICATGTTGEKQVIANGYIRFIAPNTFTIDSERGGREYFIKGDMDACAILSPREELTVPKPEDNNA